MSSHCQPLINFEISAESKPIDSALAENKILVPSISKEGVTSRVMRNFRCSLYEFIFLRLETLTDNPYLHIGLLAHMVFYKTPRAQIDLGELSPYLTMFLLGAYSHAAFIFSCSTRLLTSLLM